jgi:hypothetical protein
MTNGLLLMMVGGYTWKKVMIEWKERENELNDVAALQNP